MMFKGVFVGIFAVIVLVVVELLFKGGSPGGPIIVIQPDPGPDGGIDTTVFKGTKWNVGCLDEQTNQPIDTVPSSVNDIRFRYADGKVDSMVVSMAAGAQRDYDASKVELTIDYGGGANKLVIEFPKGSKKLRWTWNGRELQGNHGVKKPAWPEMMFGPITSLSVTERTGKQTDLTPRLEEFERISMEYYLGFWETSCEEKDE